LLDRDICEIAAIEARVLQHKSEETRPGEDDHPEIRPFQRELGNLASPHVEMLHRDVCQRHLIVDAIDIDYDGRATGWKLRFREDSLLRRRHRHSRLS
jgi:hypothetical protein